MPKAKQRGLVPVVAILLISFLAPLAQAANQKIDQGQILTAAETVFLNMAKGDYATLWRGLSGKTRESIVRSVAKAVAKSGGQMGDEQIREDFLKGGEMSRQYWKAYLTEFDPKTVLEESKWSLGKVESDRAEIVLRYKKSRNDAILKLFHEDGAWKVGLDETFSTRQ